jgi:hypothetical protein
MRKDFREYGRWPDQLLLRILTQAELPLVVPLSRFRHIRLCRQADSLAFWPDFIPNELPP